MEAATLQLLPAQIRARRFERECERLRPLGEAYVMRRFGGTLNQADAEDAVSEVVVRLHRRMTEGREPENLRAAFFTSVRNAAIDQLRSRSIRPTVALEAAVDAPTSLANPTESAEGRDDAARLQEALKRMRGNYREAIILRFGLGLTVPEISRHLNISLPAAKKLVLRATSQVRKRLESIEGEEFCPEMRRFAEQSLFDKEASGLVNEVEAEVLRAHFAHCGSCRSFVATLHDRLHDLGSSALLGLTATHQAAAGGLIDRVVTVADSTGHAAQAGAWKLRHFAYKAAGAFQSGESAAGGALLGTGQKIAAVCTAGAATTAACVATGIVGPGISSPLGAGKGNEAAPAAKVRVVETPPPAVVAPPAEEPVSEPTSQPAPEPSPTAPQNSVEKHSEAKAAPTESTASAEAQATQAEGSEFGFEGAPAAPTSSTAAPSTSTSTPATAPTTSAPSPEPTSSGGGGGSTSGSTSGGGGGETFGFGG